MAHPGAFEMTPKTELSSDLYTLQSETQQRTRDTRGFKGKAITESGGRLCPVFRRLPGHEGADMVRS